MKKKIVVHTDDPNNKKFYLTISGKVSKLVDIQPDKVNLSGEPGQSLEAVVTITPVEGQDFKILELKQKYDTQIKAELIHPEKGQRQWLVKIKSFSDKEDDLYEIITLKTDSPYKPKLKIRVYAIYLDKKNDNS